MMQIWKSAGRNMDTGDRHVVNTESRILWYISVLLKRALYLGKASLESWDTCTFGLKLPRIQLLLQMCLSSFSVSPKFSKGNVAFMTSSIVSMLVITHILKIFMSFNCWLGIVLYSLIIFLPKITALLKYNSHTIKDILLLCRIWWVLVYP